jgi:hypothetical protein
LIVLLKLFVCVNVFISTSSNFGFGISNHHIFYLVLLIVCFAICKPTCSFVNVFILFLFYILCAMRTIIITLL